MGTDRAYLCRCDCGTEKSVRAYSLLNGTSKACMSCAHAKTSRWRSHAYRRTYATWRNMYRRCHEETHPSYANYGARGIRVQWKSFANFIGDMGEQPEGLSIDRIDNNGNYSKTNCRWATTGQQARNKRTTRIVEFEGKTCPLIDLTERFGLKFSSVNARLIDGWSLERALTEPIRPPGFNQCSRKGVSHGV